ncbi:LytTR family DNA-binding domain-containing protein [Salegentibacter sp. F188]|uniref:LytTR family DNA-binding domain-containing protein n=1 Tax=Autumnicola patrickiae TaxID=3075591 RepID=A0ABU3E2X9_9FLAO|nr:LytTR family DNA-binding domain-containing protein [Salegentibacter sp. F188]MDT0690349.1 LytTR family DNA-binding domain-containing protein [Salegentibacter sp. F188]
MNAINSFFKRNITFSNFWIKNGFIIVTISILANHLIAPEHFPLNKSYEFPWFFIAISIFIGSVITLIASFNFRHFKNKYFSKKINSQVLLYFLFSTLGYISIIYIPLYYVINGINAFESYDVYYLLIGLSITLLLSTVGIVLMFSADIYQLHRLASINEKLKVKQGGKITLVNFADIAFIYSENKIVNLVKIDGASIVTDFTLNEIEDKFSKQNFFRANRQTVLHPRSIEQIKTIENGKLSILLKPTLAGKKISQINISRYKRQAFMDWFENKL